MFLLTSTEAKKLLSGLRRVSLDLGLTTSEVRVEKDLVVFPDGTSIPVGEVKAVLKKPNQVFLVTEEGLRPVYVVGRHFYKLVPTEGAPTVEVDGVRMHRTKDTTPDRDALEKVRLLRIRGGLVLDVGTGLGYTAIQEVRMGADQVVTVEVSPEVLHIARVNPWSKPLFESGRIHVVLGDAYRLVEGFPDEAFDYVVHDPPRFSMAGELYSLDFYRALYRVLKPGGRLFHYVGKPGHRFRGVDLRRGVRERLLRAGFRSLRYHEPVMGFTCVKPSRRS